ncbi:MFS transporter [Quadrisphaera oryzae]|uniref:MFS transporter n=1 Tax=Quadrisphaera TaxID=317661 RepID=UPI001646333C|nr:MFS transporter [Quadrisphaera sp. RL12-1S]
MSRWDRLDRVVDTRPLRASPPFRRLWLGGALSTASGQLASTTVLFQVWQLTGSSAWVGAVGAATAVPTLVCGLLGGQLADTLDRRRLAVATTAAALAAALALAVQGALGSSSVVLLLALVVTQTAAGSLGAAARRTFVSALLPREQVPAGVALTHLTFQAALLLGPLSAGAVLAVAGPGAAYLLDAAALLVVGVATVRLPRAAGGGGSPRPSHLLAGLGAAARQTWDGWRLVARRPALSGSVALDAAATVLAMPVALFPALNAARFADRPATLGLFFSALAVGGLAAGLATSALTRAQRPGVVQLVSAAVWGLALAGAGLADDVAVVLVLLAVAGAADSTGVIARGTLVQLDTPDAYLGRVSALENVVGVAGPGVGNARAGLVSSWTSPGAALVSGGVACAVLVAAVAATNPVLRRWRPPAS